MKLCICGSGKGRIERRDARGIFLTFACEDCWPEKSRTYRADVLSDPNYWADEEIDPDPLPMHGDLDGGRGG